MSADRKFPSKLLIAGEFTVLTGGDALAIPFYTYSGKWKKLEDPDPLLYPFGEYLLQADFIDSGRLIHDLTEGWQFKSDIPAGYGLGSSGALTAAVYHHYRISTSEVTEEIQSQLARMEDYFHGKSSGFDPLISYQNQAYAVLDHTLTPLAAPYGPGDAGHLQLYLLDSGTLRGKINSIEWFYNELVHQNFSNQIRILTEYNRNLVQAWIQGETEKLAEWFRKISMLQFEYFQPLIAPSVLTLWAKGLDTQEYFIKLCGKGGGGYYLLWKNGTINEPLTGLTKVWLT